MLLKGANVEKELIDATTRLTVLMLSKSPTSHMDLTEGVISSAFAAAYRGLKAGVVQVDAEGKRPPMQISQKALRDTSA